MNARKTNQGDTKLAQTTAEPRAKVKDKDGQEIPVFCAHDELVPIAKIIPNPKNPNKHPKEQIHLLATIIEGQGWRAPITVSRRSGFVVRGHGRLEAARQLNLTKVPIDYQNYTTEAEEYADLIADNRIAELSEIDNKLLVDLIQEMDTGEIPVLYTGYTNDDLEKIIQAMDGADDTVPDDADELPEMKKIPMTKTGDLWMMGPHRLICGSATDKDTIKRLMNGEKGRMVFTDPPYGVSYVSKSGKYEMIENDDLTGDKLIQELLLPAFKNYMEWTDQDAPFYIWHASSTRKDFDFAIERAGLFESQYIIWAKNGISLGHSDYRWAHEPCYYCNKGNAAAFYGDRAQPTVWKATFRLKGEMQTVLGGGIVLTDGKGGKIYLAGKPPKGKKTRYIRVNDGLSVFIYQEEHLDNLWEVARETKTEHPTQKPVELVARALDNSTRPGELVLDFFGGSGSVMAGCELLGRRAYCTELDPQYCDVIVNRYVRLSGNLGAVCVRDGKEIPYVKLKAENDEVNANVEVQEE